MTFDIELLNEFDVQSENINKPDSDLKNEIILLYKSLCYVVQN